MSTVETSSKIELPEELRSRLLRLRSRLWRVKSAESVLAAWSGLLVSYLLVFALDRFVETTVWFRSVLLLAGATGFVFFVPLKLHRWLWRCRRLEEVAGVVRARLPHFGDRLLGTVELAESGESSEMSPALCRAAIAQVADEIRQVDLGDTIPRPRHRRWAWIALTVTVLATGALGVPGAGPNALARWLLPWQQTPRYTFAQLEPLPSRLVVPLAESFTFEARLRATSPWKPYAAAARYASQEARHATRTADAFRFELPPQSLAGRLRIRAGDARAGVAVAPMARPEMLSLTARIELPKYLRLEARERDARGGSLAVLTGSRVVLVARTTRALAAATFNGSEVGVEIAGDRILTPPFEIGGEAEHELRWIDEEGLSASGPFTVHVSELSDRAPLVRVSGLHAEQVVLVSEVVGFEVDASDDFGVQRIGVEWSEVLDPVRNPEPRSGEYILAGGSPETSTLRAHGAFQAERLAIAPQVILLRVWVEDYLPDRERTYSPTFRLHVLSPEEHMIWVTEKLRKWERQVLEVRDEEQRLLDENRELNGLSAAELAEPSRRAEIEQQAARERANAQRLRSLTEAGDLLISEAARNDEFNAAILEKWSATLQALKEIAAKRMPSVARLLAQAAARPAAAEGRPPEAPSVRDAVAGARRDPPERGDEGEDAPPPSSSSAGRLTLPTTSIPGGVPPPGGTTAGSPPPGENPALAAAVEEQEQLLAEFERVMGEMREILQHLYGSTFVKRLKHAARQEKELASALSEGLEETFAAPAANLEDDARTVAARLAAGQGETASFVSYIQDDLDAFFERTQEPKFDKVYREMRSARVVDALKDMSSAVEENRAGETIAQAEYWTDELDRWAEILVGPG